MPNAEVLLPTLGLSLRMSERGSLLVTGIPEGVYLLQARQIGVAPAWQAVRVGRDTTRVQLVLGARTLDTVTIYGRGTREAGRLFDFDRRRRIAGFGKFITREEIEQRRPVDFAALVRVVPGVRVSTGPGGASIASTRVTGHTTCSGMLVFLDGVLVAGQQAGGAMRLPFAGSDAGYAPPPFDLNLIPVSVVAGVEVYRSAAGLPAEYLGYGGAECGVVLVWTAAR